MAIATKAKKSSKQEEQIIEFTKQDARQELKKMLIKCKTYVQRNQHFFNDANIEFHIGSIIQKFLGGEVPESLLAEARQAQGKTSASRVLTHQVQTVKKNLGSKRDARPVIEESVSTLKQKAKAMGINTAGKEKEEIIEMIQFQLDAENSLKPKSKGKQILDMREQVARRGIQTKEPDQPEGKSKRVYRKKKEVTDDIATEEDMDKTYKGLGATLESKVGKSEEE